MQLEPRQRCWLPTLWFCIAGPLASTPSDADMAEAVGSPAAGAAAAADVDVADAAQEAAPEQPAELMAANATAVDADAAATAMLLGFSEASGAAAGGGGTAAEEELPLGNEDHDGFHLEEFQVSDSAIHFQTRNTNRTMSFCSRRRESRGGASGAGGRCRLEKFQVSDSNLASSRCTGALQSCDVHSRGGAASAGRER